MPKIHFYHCTQGNANHCFVKLLVNGILDYMYVDLSEILTLYRQEFPCDRCKEIASYTEGEAGGGIR